MKYYVVDAFTTEPFGGNPAGVCLVDAPLSDVTMQQIASENNLSETAFVSANGDAYNLRWFTPAAEIDLCGHATLATAYVLDTFCQPRRDTYRFHTMSGELAVTVRDGLLEMDFPSRPPTRTDVTPEMADAIGVEVLEAYVSRDLILLVESAESVARLEPDMGKIKAIPDVFAVAVTSKGDGDADFVSRFFAPRAGIPEDPVTGSSHSSLIPFWASRLGKQEMLARQLSPRGGTLYCRDAGDRVLIGGQARVYLQGSIEVK